MTTNDTGGHISKQVLSSMSPPSRLLYRAVWRPGYARAPRWKPAAAPNRTERLTP
jgi:hypothetical protein